MIVERVRLERRIQSSLDGGRIPVILGACGSGRTSLLLRLTRSAGPDRSQYFDFAAAATTPERCFALVRDSCTFPAGGSEAAIDSPRAAFDGLMNLFDHATALDGEHVTFAIDEALDVRTFESFPGLRHVQRELVTRLAHSPNRFVLTSRFTARAHRLLRDAPARFEVIHVTALDAQEVQATARLFSGADPDWPGQFAPAVHALADGRAAYVAVLVEALASMGTAIDPVAALAALFAPDGRLTARCRESYEFRLHRARGYGALKAILGILADHEPVTLTEIAHHLHRTPGSTKDYLSWLEDVDLITSQRKRYTIEDPLIRLFVRLYAKPQPPTDADLVREVRQYAQSRLQRATAEPAPVLQPIPAPRPEPTPALATVDRVDMPRSGIIEID